MKIAISSIKIGDDRRAVDTDKVKSLADSIKEVGLLNPVVVSQDNVLVAGMHRIEAYKLLGYDEIPITLAEPSDKLRLRLAELDENLIRNEGTELEQNEWLAERKGIYEQLYPETVHGVNRHTLKSRQNDDSRPERFTENTSKQIGQSERTIQRKVARVENIPQEVRDIIRNTPSASKGTELDILAKIKEPEKQRKIAKKVASGEAKDIKKAIQQQRDEEIQEAANAVAISNQEPKIEYEYGDVVEIGNHILICRDNMSPEVLEQISLLDNPALAFCDPPYNADAAEYDDGSFEWEQDFLSEHARIVAVTCGISSIPDFMRVTEMPYKWSTSTHISNGMTRSAIGFGNWIYTAIFSYGSIYQNRQDVSTISISGKQLEFGDKRQKPTQYLAWLIELFSEKGDWIIDAFGGSGNTAIVADNLGRNCLIVERDVTTFNHMVANIKAHVDKSEVKVA